MVNANLRWYESMRMPERVLVEAHEQAKQALLESSRARDALERAPEIIARAERIADERNSMLRAHQTRLDAWRNERAAVERAGVLEFLVSQAECKSGVAHRLLDDADGKQSMKVLAVDRHTLSDGYVTRFAILEANDGSRRLQPLQPYEEPRLKEGRQVVIEQAARGLSLRVAGHSRGLGR